jgi:hypothetical protein
MHFEILIEDISGKKLIEAFLPRIFPIDNGISWRIISYKGVGRIPTDLRGAPDPANRQLLTQLPRLLKGYGKTYPEGNYGISIIVVLDCDRNNCRTLLSEMQQLLNSCSPKPNAIFRIAIEECEAWILGDYNAILSAYPRAKTNVINRYIQDSICGTWEVLADAIYPGGSLILSKKPYFKIGKAKCEWADRIGPKMDVENNNSLSFCKFRDGLRRLAYNPER